MRLRNVGKSFRGKHKIDGGPHFYGQILDPPDTSRVSNFLSARRYLRVHNNSPVRAGMIVNVDKKDYLVATHATGFFRNPIYTHFKLFQIDATLEWISKSDRIKNPITGVWEVASDVSKGDIKVSVQPKSTMEDELRIQTPQHVVLSAEELVVGDKLGPDWVVTKVDPQLDVWVIDVKEG